MNKWQARAWFLVAMSSAQSSEVSSKSVASRSRSFKAMTSSWLSSSGISFLFRLTSVIWWSDAFVPYWILRSQHAFSYAPAFWEIILIYRPYNSCCDRFSCALPVREEVFSLKDLDLDATLLQFTSDDWVDDIANRNQVRACTLFIYKMLNTSL